MGIKIEFNPDLALRDISEHKKGNRKIEECIPEKLEEGKIYEEDDFNKIIEIKEREAKRVQIVLDEINQNEKTIIFCANQSHALMVRDLVNQMKNSSNPNYCVRVTANDGARGEQFLREFQDNEKTIPVQETIPEPNLEDNNFQKPEEIKELSPEVKSIQSFANSLKRLQADFENYIKRAEKDKQEFTKYASHRLISKLLNTLDDFERTLNIVDVVNDKAIKEGIEMVYKQLQKILTEEGVKPIEVAEKKFDPYMHEVLDIVEGKEDNKIVDELQKGYLLHDKVLRTSKVRITKSQSKEMSKNNNENKSEINAEEQ